MVIQHFFSIMKLAIDEDHLNYVVSHSDGMSYPSQLWLYAKGLSVTNIAFSKEINPVRKQILQVDQT